MWNTLLRSSVSRALSRGYSSSTKNTNSCETHYDVLNLPRNCKAKDIREAFIKLSKQYHPDTSKSKESQEKFVKISNAYAILSKPESRRNYDLGLIQFHSYQDRKSTYVYTDTKHPYMHRNDGRNSWDDPSFYRNRDQTKDKYYSEDPYYGIAGVNRVSNSTIAVLCLLVAFFAVSLQVFAIRHSVTFNRDEMQKRSAETAELLQKIRNDAMNNSNEQQIELLKERFRKTGVYKD